MIQPTLTPELEKKLGQVVKDLKVYQHESEFWAQVVEKTCHVLSAESGSFFELSTDSRELRVVASFGVLSWRLSQAHFPLDKGICGWVARHRQTICVNEVPKDVRFNGEVDVLTEFKTPRDPVCACGYSGAPVRRDRILNLRERPFSTSDTEFLEALGSSAATLFRSLRKPA